MAPDTITFSGAKGARNHGFGKRNAQIPAFGPSRAEIERTEAPPPEGKPNSANRPRRKNRDRAPLRLTCLSVMAIEDEGQDRSRDNIEDNDIDVRMSFDQGEH